MNIKPASGQKIPDPEKGGFLPPEGREVEATAYWLRRLAEGDVTEVEVVKKPKEKRNEITV